MKRIAAFLACLLLVTNVSFAVPTEELKDLYDKRQFFDLRDRLREAKGDDLFFYRGVVENKFNRPDTSIATLKNFIAKPGKDASLLREAYSLLADNYVKTFRYAEATKTYESILTKFADTLSERERSSYQNVLGLWKGLSGVRPQKATFRGDSQIQMVRERVGLMVPVGVGSSTEPFIFDTGANLSTITESMAAKLGLQIIDVPFDVGSITGNTVKARIGVAKELKLGNVTFENVAFIVFPDKALYIEQIKYQINGIIGFPVIKALNEFTLTKELQVNIPVKPGKFTAANLAIDGLMPLIAGVYGGKRLAFAFDTGARMSSLYPPFFRAFEKEITAAGEASSASITGAGGSKQVSAFKLKDLSIKFGGKTPVFKTVEVLTQETTANSRYFYGNIGRDMIDQFEKMTISFASMSVVFE